MGSQGSHKTEEVGHNDWQGSKGTGWVHKTQHKLHNTLYTVHNTQYTIHNTNYQYTIHNT